MAKVTNYELNFPNFLESAVGLKLKTYTIPQALGELVNGVRTVKEGTVFPSNDSEAFGIVFKSVDVTNGNAIGSVMVGGFIYPERVHTTIEADAKLALNNAGVILVDEPTTTRPDFGDATIPNLAMTDNIAETAGTLSWDAVDNAEGYIVQVNDIEVAFVTTNALDISGMDAGTYTFTIIAIGDGVDYKNSKAKSAIIELSA